MNRAVELAVQSIRDNDQQLAAEVINKKDSISNLAEQLLSRKSERLGRYHADELETARIEISLIDKMRRTYSLARRIARIVLPPEVAKDV